MIALAEPSTTQRDVLTRQVVHVMRRLTQATSARVVIDRQTWSIRFCGDGPANTHIRAAVASADPERYIPIPSRDRIETLAQIAAFLDEEYAPINTSEHREALDALTRAASPLMWRAILGEAHPAVHAFDVFMRDVHLLVARMLLHGIREPQVGVLGTDRLARTRFPERTRPLALAPDDRGHCPSP